MRLAGALSLAFDAPPALTLFSSPRHGGFVALEIRERREGNDPGAGAGAEVAIFVPPALAARLARAAAAFNAAMEDDSENEKARLGANRAFPPFGAA